MAIAALHTAATGLSALSTNIDVIANNLANVNTTAFKASRANFEDLLYQQKAQPGLESADGGGPPAGLQVGMGTRISNTQYDFATGSPINTGRPLDVMVEGQGFFRVGILESQGANFGYTRAGNFFVNKDGDIVLGSNSGPRLDPPISIGEDIQALSVSPEGRVSVIRAGETQASEVGQIQLYNFTNPGGLKSIGGNVYVQTDASGDPINGVPGQGNFGTILQNFLESSNVDPVKELVSLIKTQRAFEMNSQSIQAADQALQVVSNLKRV